MSFVRPAADSRRACDGSRAIAKLSLAETTRHEGHGTVYTLQKNTTRPFLWGKEANDYRLQVQCQRHQVLAVRRRTAANSPFSRRSNIDTLEHRVPTFSDTDHHFLQDHLIAFILRNQTLRLDSVDNLRHVDVLSKEDANAVDS